MRFHIVNLGCRVNRVEADTFAAALMQAGHLADSAAPDVVIVNTCTVTGEADKKTRKAVHRALREHPQAAIVVTGCAAAIDAQTYEEMDRRVIVVGKQAVVETVLAIDGDVGHGIEVESLPPRYGEDFPTRVGVKVQDGCDNACTFCIVHVARGQSRSRSAEACLAEVEALYEAGAREVVLTGIDLGNYHDGGVDLSGLLEMMLPVVPQGRIRISSIEPQSVTDELIELMARADGAICRHLHLPLQSGSTKVLREMARHYTAEDYVRLVERLYEAMPQLSLTTDIIVGFPGETEEDFACTLDLVRRCHFSKVHAFRYSRRQGTPAAARTDQVAPEVAASRMELLTQVADEMRRVGQLARLESAEALLVEQEGVATSESYFTVSVGNELRRGELVTRTLTSLDEHGIFSL